MDALFETERHARIAGDTEQLRTAQRAIIAQCNTDDEIISALRMLVNKRQQNHDCFRSLIHDLLAENRSAGFYRRLLTDVIEGRLFLEAQRLDTATTLQRIAGNAIAEHYDVIRVIPVETFTTISAAKRHAFLFEQFRLALLLHETRDAELVSRRIKRPHLTEDELIIYLRYLVMLRVAQKAYTSASSLLLELSEHDPCRKHVALASFYCILSSSLTEGRAVREERAALIQRLAVHEHNDPEMRTHIAAFGRALLVDFEIIDRVWQRIRALCDEAEVGTADYQQEARQSVTEHNFWVVDSCASKVHIKHLCAFLALDEAAAIEFVSAMVNAGFSTVKIDQETSLVLFKERRWQTGVDRVLDKLNEAGVLIEREMMSK